MLMPFGWRRLYETERVNHIEGRELLVKQAQDLAAILHDQYARYDGLLDKYHALKLQGASTPEPVQMLERPAVDPVKVAIQKAAGRDRALQAVMSRAAISARSRGESDEDIIAAIEHGVEDDEGIPA